MHLWWILFPKKNYYRDLSLFFLTSPLIAVTKTQAQLSQITGDATPRSQLPLFIRPPCARTCHSLTIHMSSTHHPSSLCIDICSGLACLRCDSTCYTCSNQRWRRWGVRELQMSSRLIQTHYIFLDKGMNPALSFSQENRATYYTIKQY